MQIQLIELNKLVPYATNPRNNEQAVDKVAASVREFGFRQPIVVDEQLTIIAGHTRYLAAQKLGLSEVPIHVATGLTKAQIKAYRLADNRVAQEATWDDSLLAAELEGLKELEFDLNLTGFNPDELDKLLHVEQILGNMDEESIPELPAVSRSKKGDVWMLESHRVMCGDSSDVDAITKLMGSRKADLLFTDPPYNLAEKGKNVASNIDNGNACQVLKDSEWDYGFKVEPFLNASLGFLAAHASMFVCTSHFLFGNIIKWMGTALEYNNYCVWCKPNPMPSLTKRRFTWATELICYGSLKNHIFNFPADGHALNYLLETSPSHTTEHPTEKPVKVPEHFILLASKPKNIVLDLFGGSGSTLIACEKNNRINCTMELDPKYVDVIVKRWQDFTGKKAVLESTGEIFDE